MEKLANAPISTLSASINNTDTTLSVASASTFPTAGTFRILVEDEIMKVTGVSGTTFTISRGQEGTTAVSHGSGATITAIVTKNSLETLLGEQFQSGVLSSRPTTPEEGTTWCDTDSLYEYVYHGGNWELTNPVYIPASRQLDLSGWTGVNLTGVTWTTRSGVVHVKSTATSSPSHAYYHKVLPSAPYKLNTIIKPLSWQIQWYSFSLALHDTVTGKFLLLDVASSSNLTYVIIEQYNSYNSYNATPIYFSIWFPEILHLQIEDDNTNWYFRISMDGVNFVTFYQCARNTFLTPTDVALTTNQNSGLTIERHTDIFAYWEG